MQNLYAPPKAELSEPLQAASFLTAKRVYVASLLALAGVYGLVSGYFYPQEIPEALDWGIYAPFPFLVFLWYRTVAREDGYRRSIWLNIGVVLLPAIAIPYFFIRSRGWKRGLLAILLALVFFFAFVGICAAAAMGVFWYKL